MINSAFHPATIQLLRLQSRGRRRRMARRFCDVRRLVLSAIACILAAVWLGNAALTIWLRESASPESLRALLSLGLVTYAGWHLAKSAFFRPQGPFDWSPTEHELLLAMPLASRDLVAYQLASVTVTTFLKATIFTVLLLPDLRSVGLGLVGLLLAMMVLEMLRMTIDIATWGMGQRAYQAYRAAVVAVLVVTGFAIGTAVMREGPFRGQLAVDEGLRQRLLDTLVLVSDKVFGYVGMPFRPLVDLILADRVTAANVGLATAALAVVTALAAGVIGLYAVTSRRVARREKSSFAAAHVAAGLFGGSARDMRDRALDAESSWQHVKIPRWCGAGALAWRQMTGARRHWGSLLTAMIAPAVLATFPAFVVTDPNLAFLATTGTLAFYTFLLLPTAIRFDFRRDLDQLAVLKGLPITPAAAAIGQIATPVLLATLFQSVVLAFAVAARSLPLYYWCWRSWPWFR